MIDTGPSLQRNDVNIVIRSLARGLSDLPEPHPEEFTRAARFHHERDAQAHLIGRALARQLTGFSAGCGVFPVGPRGKPFVPDGAGFSISHSGEWVGVVVGANGDVGLDIEVRSERLDPAGLLHTICSDAEAHWVAKDSEPPARFLAVWTRKEALLKQDGSGLINDLRSLDTQPGALDGSLIAGKRLWSGLLPDGAAFALATHSGVATVQLDVDGVCKMLAPVAPMQEPSP